MDLPASFPVRVNTLNRHFHEFFIAYQINKTGTDPVMVSVFSGKYSIVALEESVKTNCNSRKQVRHIIIKMLIIKHIMIKP